MLFNSFAFLIFFPIVTLLYFLVGNKLKVLLLLAASCLFYMAFIPEYILILFATILVDYIAGLIIVSNVSALVRKLVLWFSIIVTCLILFAFKYFNFFAESATNMAHFFGMEYSVPALKIILPIGLSFHTFQSLSYVIEVYRGHQRAERNFWIYSLYVMFFPQLVAGPIERPQNLLHQFHNPLGYDYDRMTQGLLLMAWGLFKKVVIADRLAILVDHVYGKPGSQAGVSLLIATVFFAVQIYCDFSGYSDIARGSARVLGFEFMKNFERPYFSSSVTEFWRRWHISLSTWFRDYVYFPLGGNRCGELRTAVNLLLTFLISGLWHGANWTFIIWGGANGLLLLSERLIGKGSKNTRFRKWLELSSVYRVFSIVRTFLLICMTWIFFRAGSWHDAITIISRLGNGWDRFLGAILENKMNLFSNSFVSQLNLGLDSFDFGLSIFLILFLFSTESLQERNWLKLISWIRQPAWIRWPAYLALVYLTIIFWAEKSSQFIYFQF